MDVDVVVAGGGPAGAAAALTLARAGRRVVLADAGSGSRPTVGEALVPAARTALRDLGVWREFRREGHLPCYGTRVAWGSPHPRDTDFLFDPNGHGWQLDRPRFDGFLRAAAGHAGAEVRERTSVRVRGREDDGWLVGLGGREEIRARWLVDATGRAAGLARGRGVARQRQDRLLCLFAYWGPGAGQRGTDRDARTLVEAAPGGWWYSALLPSGNRVVAHLTDPDLAGRVLRTTAGFAAGLDATELVGAQLAAHGYQPRTEPRGAPADSSWLGSAAGDGWVAVGDAALACDPISSQGILTALVTGIAAGAVLGEPQPQTVAGYARWLHRMRAHYRHNHRTCYGLERRWPDHPFWRRRAQACRPAL